MRTTTLNADMRQMHIVQYPGTTNGENPNSGYNTAEMDNIYEVKYVQ